MQFVVYRVIVQWLKFIVAVVSASLHWAKRYWYRTFVPPICRSSHVSSGDTGDWIRMPFGVVSGVGLGMDVWDFGGDRRRGRGSLGWIQCRNGVLIDYRLVVQSWQYFPTQNVSLNSVKDWLSYDIVRFKIKLGSKRNSCAKMRKNVTKQTQHGDTPVQLWPSSHFAASQHTAAYERIRRVAESSRILLGSTRFEWRQHARAVRSQ